MANPLLIMGGLSAAGAIYNRINPDEATQIQRNVLRDMQARRQRLSRMARGKFTGAEREGIASAAEPGMNQLAGNLAQRGLGTSGAGAQVLGQASVQPFVQARGQAEMMLGQANMQALDASQLLAADDSFFDDIEGIAQGYFTLQGLGADDDDGLLNSVLKTLNMLMGNSAGGSGGGAVHGPFAVNPAFAPDADRSHGPQADPKVFDQLVGRKLF